MRKPIIARIVNLCIRRGDKKLNRGDKNRKERQAFNPVLRLRMSEGNPSMLFALVLIRNNKKAPDTFTHENPGTRTLNKTSTTRNQKRQQLDHQTITPNGITFMFLTSCLALFSAATRSLASCSSFFFFASASCFSCVTPPPPPRPNFPSTVGDHRSPPGGSVGSQDRQQRKSSKKKR